MSWSTEHLDRRIALASAAVLFLSAAWALQTLDPASGRCLQTGGFEAGHCALCWIAAALGVLAVAPYPTRRADRSPA